MPAGHSKLGCCLFLCLLFRGTLSACTLSSTSECHSANFVPGALLAGRGYDVVTLQLKGSFVINMKAWRMANGSCTLCNNGLQGGARQRLPTSLTDWRTLSSCQRSLSSQLFRSAAHLAESAGSAITNDWRADLSLAPKPRVTSNLVLAGSKSKMAAFGITRSKSDRYSFTSHQFQCRYYQYRVKDKPLLAPDFTRSLSSLPTVMNDGNNVSYQKLVATYGTHYLTSVELGGRFKDVTAIRTCKAAFEGYTTEEVKDCLSIEASTTVSLKANASASRQKCQQMARNMKHHNSFHKAFSERETEVTGGKALHGSDLFFSGDGTAFARWLESLPSEPGAVRYALAPLHHLLPAKDPRQENLRRYISDYITRSALSQQCKVGAPCPRGSYRNPRQPCNCVCLEDNRVDHNCCSKEKGLGHLVVTVKEGRDLWGDVFSGTDGYVVVRYGLEEARTNVISNNNNPLWNTKLDLGGVKARSGYMLNIEVWDEDPYKWDNLLGNCEVRLTSGTHSKVCYLNYGKVTYDYTFTCGPHLGGATCQDYTPGPVTAHFSAAVGITNSTRLLHTFFRA